VTKCPFPPKIVDINKPFSFYLFLGGGRGSKCPFPPKIVNIKKPFSFDLFWVGGGGGGH
jgi:hypothetical protein